MASVCSVVDQIPELATCNNTVLFESYDIPVAVSTIVPLAIVLLALEQRAPSALLQCTSL